jgi:hypothetical protein
MAQRNLVGLTTSEMDELDRLRHTLGQEAFNEIQRVTFNDYIVTHQPSYTPGVWHALLKALRESVRHYSNAFRSVRSNWREVIPPMSLLETCWELRSPRGLVLSCGVFRTIAGLEVRCGFGDDELIRSQYVVEIGTARAIAIEWTAAELKGFIPS